MPKYSIITINHQGIGDTIACIDSVLANTRDFELIVVDNFSQDGSVECLNARYNNKGLPIKIVPLERRGTFAANNNVGLQSAIGEYVIFLNNDTVVSKDWLDRMEAHFENCPIENVGAVGPVTNCSNGVQSVGNQNPEEWYQKNRGRWQQAAVLYGWCVMVKKSIIDEIGGFDERFHNSWEDNDLSLRIQNAGYQLIIAGDTYIYHKGQGTLKRLWTIDEYAKNGADMKAVFYDKYNEVRIRKLVAVYRTNGGKWLEESLKRTSEFADHIIIHFCRMKSEGIWTKEQFAEDLVKKFPKIKKIGFYDGIFQEDYERDWLLQEALKLKEQGEADWCISVDDDEIYEKKIIDRIQRMMNPRNPHILAYTCNWRTIWENRLGKEYFRADSTFGSFKNYRLFKLIKGQRIRSSHPEGHHCGSAPNFAPENVSFSNIRVKHLGYDTPEQRQKKFEFYQANDNFKRKADIGFDDYSHLISTNVALAEYREAHGLSIIMMLKNEEDFIEGSLENLETIADEFVIVNTGSTDKTFDIVKEFSDRCPVPFRIIESEWPDNYSVPRNLAKYYAKFPYVMFSDADERFKPNEIYKLYEMTEHDYDVILINVINYLEAPRQGVQTKAAPTQAARIFRNVPDFYFTGVVHETIDDASVCYRRKNGLKGVVSPVEMAHYGYLKNNDQVQKKMEYYEGLNNKQMEITEGKDPRPYYNIALHYMHTDRMSDALRMLQKALEIRPNFWNAAQQMGSQNLINAKEFFKRACVNAPDSHPSKAGMLRMIEMIEANVQGFVKV